MEVKLYQGLLEINWNLLFSAITVLVLYLILKHFFFEKVHKFMEARKAAVQDNLDRAKATEEEAQALLSEYQATLSNAEKKNARSSRRLRQRLTGERTPSSERPRSRRSGLFRRHTKTCGQKKKKLWFSLKKRFLRLRFWQRSASCKENWMKKVSRR